MWFKEKIVNGTGCERDVPDSRDFRYADVLGAASVDWEKGYNAFEDLRLQPEVFDQNGSLSCVAQATIPLLRRWTHRLTSEDVNFSRKFIYAQIALPQGGSYLRDSMKFVSTKGDVLEMTVPSYKNGTPPDEIFMRAYEVLPEHLKEALPFDRFNYRMIEGQTSSIDLFAQAIQQNLGVLGGFTITNEGWNTPVVRAPMQGETRYGHAVDLCGFGMYGNTKCLFTTNSWGGRYTIQEGRWKGFQAIPEDYFTAGEETAAGFVKGIHVFNAWVFVPDADVDEKQKALDFAKKHEGKIIQDSEQSGGFALLKNGKKLVASKDRLPELIATYLTKKEGVPTPKEIWNDIPSEKF